VNLICLPYKDGCYPGAQIAQKGEKKVLNDIQQMPEEWG
jgi:hypothetical protein